MEQEKFTYQINGKTYTQRPLVLGQVNQLMGLLKGLVIPAGADPMMLISVLCVRLPKAMAIVLIEDMDQGDRVAVYLKDRDLDALAAELEFNIDPGTAMQVIEDFFDCNPIASLFERFAGMTEKFSRKSTGPGPTASASS